ncbi:uncharacterized protein [Rhodnius prolixus]|uniref:uncharacterized protein n=1 Tax=Rhodnius prolixus TaxID=13249 RepID=UPI003D189610
MAEDGAEFEGKNNPKTILAQALLACSGIHGLSMSQTTFAGPAYGISAVTGVIGVITNITGNDTLNKIYRYVNGLCRCLVVPLIATEVCVASGIKIELAALNLLYPTVHYIAKYIANKDDLANHSYLEASHAVSICAIAYFSFVKENWWGVGLAIIYAMSCLGQNVIDEPQFPTASLGIGNFMYTFKVK